MTNDLKNILKMAELAKESSRRRLNQREATGITSSVVGAAVGNVGLASLVPDPSLSLDQQIINLAECIERLTHYIAGYEGTST